MTEARSLLASRPEDLPDFDNPPVTEVVLGMQFKRIPRFAVVHLGLLWEQFKGEFPRWQEVPPLEPSFEVFGSPQGPEGGFQISMVTGLLPRLWLINDADTKLLQIQPDRFIHNWRKVGTADVYPRYEQIRSGFLSAVERFSRFLVEHQLDALQPNQCEVSYINHIPIPEGQNWQRHLGRVFVAWNDDATGARFEIEDVRFLTRHLLRLSDGSPNARLISQMEPTVQRNGRPMLALNLSVRGRPSREDLESVVSFFDAGRDCIVRQFTAMTTPEMHKLWGRKR